MAEESTRLSCDDKAGVCQQWQANGLSISPFCKQKKIVVSIFKGWWYLPNNLIYNAPLLQPIGVWFSEAQKQVLQVLLNAPSTFLPNSICSRAKNSNSLISMRSGSKEIGSISLRLSW